MSNLIYVWEEKRLKIKEQGSFDFLFALSWDSQPGGQISAFVLQLKGQPLLHWDISTMILNRFLFLGILQVFGFILGFCLFLSTAPIPLTFKDSCTAFLFLPQQSHNFHACLI